jgi:hypothetical protein
MNGMGQDFLMKGDSRITVSSLLYLDEQKQKAFKRGKNMLFY